MSKKRHWRNQILLIGLAAVWMVQMFGMGRAFGTSFRTGSDAPTAPFRTDSDAPSTSSRTDSDAPTTSSGSDLDVPTEWETSLEESVQEEVTKESKKEEGVESAPAEERENSTEAVESSAPESIPSSGEDWEESTESPTLSEEKEEIKEETKTETKAEGQMPSSEESGEKWNEFDSSEQPEESSEASSRLPAETGGSLEVPRLPANLEGSLEVPRLPEPSQENQTISAPSSAKKEPQKPNSQTAKKQEVQWTKLTLIQKKENQEQDVTNQFQAVLAVVNQKAVIDQSQIAAVPENDGVYTLIVTTKDAQGKEQTQKQTFSVNRFGSAYTFSEYFHSLRNAYVREVTDNLIIREFNPDPLLEHSLRVEISRDNVPLDHVDYQVNQMTEEGQSQDGIRGWYQYEYVIAAENFSQDGIYKISLSSEDESGNQSEIANYETGNMVFRVDTTPPDFLRVERKQEDTQNFTLYFQVFDAIGLKSLTVYADNQIVQVCEPTDDITQIEGALLLAQKENQTIRLVAEDLAGNVSDRKETKQEGAKAGSLSEEMPVSQSDGKKNGWIVMGILAIGFLEIKFLWKKRK